MRVAIDTGGTFTDCIYLAGGEIRVLKVFSSPASPASAVLGALAQIAAAQPMQGSFMDVRHGTTVGTNAMLERKGARVAFVTTLGFEDTIAIGRQARSQLYNWFAPLPICLVPRELRFGVPERVSAEGKILRTPTEAELQALVESVRASKAESVAISLLFSFAQPENELRVEAALQQLAIPISTSHRILPEFREYERASTTVVNAYLAPKIGTYLLQLERQISLKHYQGQLNVMQSSGGIIPARLAALQPVRTVLSGPAGGVIGACQVARWAGYPRIIGFDMGGTSTDVFLSNQTSGAAQLTRESIVAGMPIGIPILDIHTAGAGGGSIARFDTGGLLHVGPESAGADPGPICFGRGQQPTVTDANLLLCRLDPESFLGGSVPLDRERTRELLHQHKGSLPTAHHFAHGILRVVEAQMEKAIRVISVERGHDPRHFTLVAFGGGGPLHACSLARSLRIPTVIIPAKPGALSAVGILLADVVRDYSLTIMRPGNAIADLESAFNPLDRQAQEEFTAEALEGVAQHTVDLRYQGQGYELNVPFDPQSPASSIELFHQSHQQLYGFSDHARPIEIVSIRLRMTAHGEPYSPAFHELIPGNGSAAFYGHREVYFDQQLDKTSLYHRHLLVPGDSIQGPAILSEYTSATLLPPGCQAEIDGFENIIIAIGSRDKSPKQADNP